MATTYVESSALVKRYVAEVGSAWMRRTVARPVHQVLPQAQVMQLDTQANVIQALESGRVDVAVVDLSTVRWLVKRSGDKYVDAGHSYRSMLYGAAMRQGDPDWLGWVNTCFTVAMYGHQNEIYDAALEEFFGVKPPDRKPGFPAI